MVLDGLGGAGTARAPATGFRRTLDARVTTCCSQDDGVQSVEFALTLPLILLAVAVLAHLAVVATDLVAAHSVAFQAARIAAVDDDAAVVAAVREAAGDRPVEVTLEPPDGRREIGELVTASVRVRSAAFAAFGMTVWLPGSAALRVERL